MKPGRAQLQFERLGPAAIERAWVQCPITYIPLGALEWHGRHLPVGLDAIKAYDLCLSAAERTGGLVLPPLYYGTGGEHSGYPLTVIVGEREVVALLEQTVQRVATWGVELAVLFTGHFAGEQIDMVSRVAETMTTDQITVLALSDAMLPNPSISPDHAALFETSLLAAMEPELVQLDQLPPIDAAPAADPEGDCWGTHRHDPQHPLYGIFGPDPRTLDRAEAMRLHEATVDWLVATVDGARGVPGKMQRE